MNNIGTKIAWLIFGSVLLFIISPYFLSILAHLTGIDAYQFIRPNLFSFLLVLTTGYFSGFILPLLFVVLTIFSSKKYYNYFFATIVTIIMLLNAVFMAKGWELGIKYQGIRFCIEMTVVNLFCFLLLYVLIFAHYRYQRPLFLHAATLILFLTVGLFAFPWFGESI